MKVTHSIIIVNNYGYSGIWNFCLIKKENEEKYVVCESLVDKVAEVLLCRITSLSD